MKRIFSQLVVLFFAMQLVACSTEDETPSANVLPTVSAGSDLTVDEQKNVTLSGSGTDSDGSIVSYAWSQTAGTSVSISGADTATASFVAPALTEDETLSFSLKVTDNDGGAASDTVDVVVEDVQSLTILKPEAGVVYQEQSPIPISFDFSTTISSLEITNESSEIVYRTVEAVGPLFSSMKTDRLVDGENVLNVNAVFSDGSNLQQSITISVQKEPEATSSLDNSVLYRKGLSNRSEIDTSAELKLNQNESAELMIENIYSDGFVKTCVSDMAIEIADDAILSSNGNTIMGIGAGTSQATLTCGAEAQTVTVVVEQDALRVLKIEPNNLLFLGVGQSIEIEISEYFSSGLKQVSEETAISTENVNLISISENTITALRPGRTTLSVAIGDITDEVEVEVVKDIEAAQGLVTIQEGGVLTASQLIGAETVSGQLILRPNTVSLDEEFTFSILDPSTLPRPASDSETAIAAFSISPDRQFARNGIVKISPTVSIPEDSILSISILNTATNEFERIGLASLVEDVMDADIPRGGIYILHTDIPVDALAREAMLDRVELRIDDCDLPKKNWPNGSDFSSCDGNDTNALLKKYRPIIKVQRSEGDTNVAKGGEFPIRISDLLRQGKLWNLIGDNKVIDYKETLGEEFEVSDLDESDAKELLTKHNCEEDGCIELRIENSDRFSNWRDFKGVPSIYGRVVSGDSTKYEGEQFIALQYWLYYAGSTLPSGGDTLFHEGDVEFFQVLLDQDNNPVGASTGQHYYGESKHWYEVEKLNGHPVIYVAAGSHATHFNDQNAKTETGNLGFLAREGNEPVYLPFTEDKLDDSTVSITPAIIQEKTDSIFFQWKGRFGEYRAFSGDGTPAPQYRGPSEANNLSMFDEPVHYHFTYLMPGKQYAGLMEHLSRSRDDFPKMIKILAGDDAPIICSDEGVSGVMSIPEHLYEVFHSLGKMNYDFQQQAVNCPKVLEGENSTYDITSYFDDYYAGDSADCGDNEFISEAYRLYIVSGLPSKYRVTAEASSLADLLSDVDPSCALSFLDTDKDGIANSKDPDDDNDGLSDEGEAECGTDPLLADTDGDGTNDQEECQGGSDPTVPNGFVFVVSDINMFAQYADSPDNNKLIANLLSSASGERADLKAVKFYDGHGGNVGEPSTVAAAQAYIESLGYSFTYSNETVIDTDGISVLFVLYPGRTSPDNLSASEIQSLKDFVTDGGVLVAVAENGSYHYDKASYNKMLTDLGVEVSNNSDDLGGVIVTTRVSPTSVTTGVETLTVERPSTFTVDSSTTGNEVVIRLEGGQLIMLKSTIDVDTDSANRVQRVRRQQIQVKKEALRYDPNATSY